MPHAPHITGVIVDRFTYKIAELGLDYNGFNQVYKADGCLEHSGFVLSITTDVGITGEYVGGSAASYAQVGMVVQYLIGKNAWHGAYGVKITP